MANIVVDPRGVGPVRLDVDNGEPVTLINRRVIAERAR
jgi:hypothetical protein